MSDSAALGDSDAAPDPAAPLGAPAMVIAVLLFAAAVVAGGQIRGWAADYGAPLVYCAVALYIAAALRLFWWGAGVRRAGRHWDGRRVGAPGPAPTSRPRP
ncbi:hypothetical protein [Nocardia cyriacigeorgica]|uniref:Uncharacterized protein n=1 Tax=Nocardia cyriacigeorgica TaxID=135487 RepID=A0A6P1D8U2_9NOCA|nr:hypothetical protein [Nocardia cyriacigeorgica]NEW37904.1 hypothetical protein [Nocardia cyriacigeorgica]NEW46897.1 hypothetical protein [Nocardia cyriacigeorgica]